MSSLLFSPFFTPDEGESLKYLSESYQHRRQ